MGRNRHRPESIASASAVLGHFPRRIRQRSSPATGASRVPPSRASTRGGLSAEPSATAKSATGASITLPSGLPAGMSTGASGGVGRSGLARSRALREPHFPAQPSPLPRCPGYWHLCPRLRPCHSRRHPRLHCAKMLDGGVLGFASTSSATARNASAIINVGHPLLCMMPVSRPQHSETPAAIPTGESAPFRRRDAYPATTSWIDSGANLRRRPLNPNACRILNRSAA